MFLSFDILLTIILCYIIGSIPFGLLISLIFKKNDPRLEGSKNIGATNITRTSGWRLGLITLICDILKGYIPVMLLKNTQFMPDLLIFFIFLGHLFPIWLKFNGGKGIAVIIGCLTAYNTIYGLIFIFTWLIVAIISKYSSLSALFASSVVLLIIFHNHDSLFLTMLIIVIMIFLKHISNIKRLINGNESKIILKK